MMEYDKNENSSSFSSTSNSSSSTIVRTNRNFDKFDNNLKTCSDYLHFLVNKTEKDEFNDQQQKLFIINEIKSENYFFDNEKNTNFNTNFNTNLFSVRNNNNNNNNFYNEQNINFIDKNFEEDEKNFFNFMQMNN